MFFQLGSGLVLWLEAFIYLLEYERQKIWVLIFSVLFRQLSISSRGAADLTWRTCSCPGTKHALHIITAPDRFPVSSVQAKYQSIESMQMSEQSATWPFFSDLMQFIFSNTFFFLFLMIVWSGKVVSLVTVWNFMEALSGRHNFDSILPSWQDEVKFHSCAMKPAIRRNKISTMPLNCAE